jgi:Zn-dependent M28 family amino/carboxypeptidase
VDFETVAADLRADADLWNGFVDLCAMGGRMAGSASEALAQDWAFERLSAIGPLARRDPTAYAGWRCDHSSLVREPDGQALDAVPLLGTAFTPEAGLVAPVLNLGRGTPAQIAEAGEAVRGKVVMVAHEYPFSTETVHRRVKLQAAQAAGAVGFLIVQPEAGIGPVSGSSGRAGGPGIPAMGISAEAAQQLDQPGAQVRLRVRGEDLPGAQTHTLVLDLPAGDGAGAERVVLSAHLDGHPLAQSALDNATGVTAVLAIARAMAPHMARMRRGLTVCLFSAEEWALNGSREWLRALPDAQRQSIALNVNLDSLDGSPSLTALTSGFSELGGFAREGAQWAGVELGIHLPLMSNSDHANFANAGIPALRLIAGFNEPESSLRWLLTRADTWKLADKARLLRATQASAGVLWHALHAPDLGFLRSSRGTASWRGPPRSSVPAWSG